MKGGIAILCFLLFSTVHAQEFMQNDLNGMFYVSYTFGEGTESSDDNGLMLGFSLNHSKMYLDNKGRTDLFNSRNRHHSLVDISISPQTMYLSRFNVLGQDALTYPTVMKANGEAERGPGVLSWEQLAGVVILAGGVLYWLSD